MDEAEGNSPVSLDFKVPDHSTTECLLDRRKEINIASKTQFILLVDSSDHMKIVFISIKEYCKHGLRSLIIFAELKNCEAYLITDMELIY